MTPILSTIRSTTIRQKPADLSRKDSIAVPSLSNSSDHCSICSVGTADTGDNNSNLDYKFNSNIRAQGKSPSYNESHSLTPSLAATLASTQSSNNSDPSSRNSHKSTSLSKVLWHKDISYSIASGKWENIRGHLALLASYHYSGSLRSNDSDEHKTKTKVSGTSFWSRISGTKTVEESDPTGLLLVDSEQQTPLHVLLTSRKTPVDIIIKMADIEPRACSKVNNKGRLPLHNGVVHRHPIEVIAKLVDSYPAAISIPDAKNQSPLSYAFDIAKKESILHKAPPTFWMPMPEDCLEAQWQQGQAERWGVVHWLLLSSATHPQTTLSVGGKKPMLVEALFHAASPAVVSLLIGASVMLLSYENKATAFAGSTLYTCITRHYPLTILMSLATQCAKDVRKIRDETGLGLVSAQFISGCFDQITSLPQEQIPVVNQTQQLAEWKISEDFYSCFLECMRKGTLSEDPTLTDWWKKIEFLLAFCSEHDYRVLQRDYYLHVALLNSDVPPAVIRMLLALYPKSIALPWNPSSVRSNCVFESRNMGQDTAQCDPTKRLDVVDRTTILPSTESERSEMAHPLHLAAMTPDYIPRYYERDVTNRETVLDIVFNASRGVIRKRYDDRLPLHFAIGSGRLFPALSLLINCDRSQLLVRDPKTKLFPFLHVASYNNRKDEDGYRWSCIARNQYTHSEWRNLSDRNKAAAVLKVVELEDIGRVETCYQLLRLQPGVLHLCCGLQKNLNGTKRRGSSSLGRPQNNVSAHYLNWCYSYNEITSEWLVNHENQDLFQQSIRCAATSGSLLALPSTFDAFWSQLVFWIKHCSSSIRLPSRIPSSTSDINNSNGHGKVSKQLETENPSINLTEIRSIVDSQPEFLLHAALATSDTPPQVIHLLVKLYPSAVTIPVPNTTILPLHIAAYTMPYVPHSYEVHKNDNALLYVLNANKRATRQLCNGRLPLHIAVLACKSLHEIKLLIDADPAALAVRDCDYHLLPYQLMAMRRIYSSAQRLHFQSIARNSFTDSTWERMTPQEQTKHYRKAQNNHQLNVLSSIFELLRRNPAVLIRPEVQAPRNQFEASVLWKELNVYPHTSATHDNASSTTDESQHNFRLISIQVEPGQVSVSHISVSDADETEISDSHIAESGVSRSLGKNPRYNVATDDESSQSSFTASYSIPLHPENKQSSLMMLFSKNKSNSYSAQKILSDDMFECDASILSTLDVMSTLSSTVHTVSSPKKKFHGDSPKDDKDDESGEGSIRLEMFGMTSIHCHGDSVCDDFTDAQTLDSKEIGTESAHITKENDAAAMIEKISEENDGYDSDDSIVIFSMRRRPRLFSRKESNAQAPAVKLSKKASSTLTAMAQPLPNSNDSVDFRGSTSKEDHAVDSLSRSQNMLEIDDQSRFRTSCEFLYGDADIVQRTLNNSQWTEGDESSLTTDSSYRTTKEVRSFRRVESKNSLLSSRKSKSSHLARTTSKTVALDASKKGETTLLGDMQDSSHTNDDDPLLMLRRNSGYSPVSSLTTYSTSHKESLESKRSRNPSLLKTEESDDSSSKDSVDIISPPAAASDTKRRTISPQPSFLASSDGSSSETESCYQNGAGKPSILSGKSEIMTDETFGLAETDETRSLHFNEAQEVPSRNPLNSLLNDSSSDRKNEFASTNAPLEAAVLPNMESLNDVSESDRYEFSTNKNSSIIDKNEDRECDRPRIEQNDLQVCTEAPTSKKEEPSSKFETMTMDSKSRAKFPVNPSGSHRTVVGAPQTGESSKNCIQSDDPNDTEVTPILLDAPSSTLNGVCFEGASISSVEASELSGENDGQKRHSVLESATVPSIPVVYNIPPTPSSVVHNSPNSRYHETPNKSKLFSESERFLFDKNEFKWVKVPLSEASSEFHRTVNDTKEFQTTTNETNELKSETTGTERTVHRLNGNASTKETHLSTNNMYFDKASMRWRQKPESTLESNGQGSRNRSFPSDCHGFLLEKPKKQKQGKAKKQNMSKNMTPASINKEPLGKGESTSVNKSINGGPGQTAEVSLHRKNAEDQNSRHPSRLGRKSSPSIPVKTPNDSEMRSHWASMFNSETQLTCVECRQNNLEVLMLPCRHLCLCRRCYAIEPASEVCPLCGEAVNDKMLIY